MASIGQRVAVEASELSQATSDHMSGLQTIFRAIKAVAIEDPVLAGNLASVGVYLAEMAEGDFDTISMDLQKVGKEIH